MPSEFPRSPKLLKGALVVFETAIPVPTNLIVFQYNPDTVTRSFQPVGSGSGDPSAGAGDTQHIPLPPLESFQMKVELDAADQLEASNPLARGVGLHPTLAALELLLYPPSTQLILNKALSLRARRSSARRRHPGPARLGCAPRDRAGARDLCLVTEQAFDTLLNPIRAKVTLGLRALTVTELQAAGPPFDTLALVNHIAKEVLARTNIVNSVQQIDASMLPF